MGEGGFPGRNGRFRRRKERFPRWERMKSRWGRSQRWSDERKRDDCHDRRSGGPHRDAASHRFPAQRLKETWQSRLGSGWGTPSGKMPLPLCPGDAWSSVSLPPREGMRPTEWAKALAPPGGLTDPHTHGRLEDEPCFVPPFQGLDRLWVGQPGALPRAGVCRAVGAPGSCPTRRLGFTGGSPWPTRMMARRLSRNDAVGREALTRRKRGRAVSALAGSRPAARCRCHLP